MKALLLVSLLILAYSAYGSNSKYDGDKEIKKTRRLLECSFGGKTYVYKDFWEVDADQSGMVQICMDYRCKSRIRYTNGSCRYLRNKYLDYKRHTLKVKGDK